MPTLIPITRDIDDVSKFDQAVTLEGKNYTLRFDWNVRMNTWFMIVLDEEALVVCTPQRRLVVDYQFAKFVSIHDPIGIIMAIDSASPIDFATEVSYDDLGNRVLLYYFTFDELTQ